MIRLTDIHPMTGFLRDHKTYLERLNNTGRPEVLTVNGEAKVVVQDVAAYQQLLDMVEALSDDRKLREAIASLMSGEPGIPAEQVLDEVRARLNLNRS